MNRVWISGNVGDKIWFDETDNGSPAGSLMMASDRDRLDGSGTVTAWVKVNVYGRPLVSLCRGPLVKGVFVEVDGELMNREGRYGELTEIRAFSVKFVTKGVARDVVRHAR